MEFRCNRAVQQALAAALALLLLLLLCVLLHITLEAIECVSHFRLADMFSTLIVQQDTDNEKWICADDKT